MMPALQKLARWLAMMMLLLLAGMAAADEVAIPPLTTRVTDLTGTLTPEQKSSLEARLAAFEQQKGSQIAVLLVPTTRPEAIEQYGIRVAENWKLGRKGIDDGLLVLMATQDREVRIEVGYGLEGVVPDVIAKRVIEEIMIPRFREGDIAGGINAGVERLIGLVEGEPLPPPKQQTASGGAFDKYFPMVFIAAIVIGGLMRAIFGKVLGGMATGGIVGGIVWLLGAGVFFALLLAVMAFIFTLGGGRGFHGGGLGGMGGGGFGGGGFGGGGGGFGGGGASGRW
jgi:uncharacterized protein